MGLPPGGRSRRPSGLTRRMPFEEFLATRWRTPVHRPDLGRAVVAGEAAASQVDVADDRAWNAMTGCLPDHRGRGLASWRSTTP